MNAEHTKETISQGSTNYTPRFHYKMKSPRSVIQHDHFINEIKSEFPKNRRKTHELKSPSQSARDKLRSEERAKVFYDKQMSFVGNKFGKIIKELNLREESLKRMMK